MPATIRPDKSPGLHRQPDARQPLTTWAFLQETQILQSLHWESSLRIVFTQPHHALCHQLRILSDHERIHMQALCRDRSPVYHDSGNPVVFPDNNILKTHKVEDLSPGWLRLQSAFRQTLQSLPHISGLVLPVPDPESSRMRRASSAHNYAHPSCRQPTCHLQ